MRGLGSDVLSVVGPTGVSLFDFFYSCVQLYIRLNTYVCFISFFYVDLYLLGDDTSISIFHANQSSICLDPHQK